MCTEQLRMMGEKQNDFELQSSSGGGRAQKKVFFPAAKWGVSLKSSRPGGEIIALTGYWQLLSAKCLSLLTCFPSTIDRRIKILNELDFFFMWMKTLMSWLGGVNNGCQVLNNLEDWSLMFCLWGYCKQIKKNVYQRPSFHILFKVSRLCMLKWSSTPQS